MNLITFLLSSKNNTLNKIGASLYVHFQMKNNRMKFVMQDFDYGFDRMSNILKEMQYLIRGKYAGNKEYLFARMEYLIDQGFRTCIKNNHIGNIKVKSRRVMTSKRPRNAKGQFIARAKKRVRSK